ncbi:putative secreted protein, partial [Rhodopirellula maiorica SM1]
MMKVVSVLVLAVFLAASAFQISRADPPNEAPPHRITPLMKMKLDRSKAILEGLTLEDFDTISKNAKALKLLSLESGWNVLQTPEYVTQSQEFRRTADMIAEAAKEKNISRATLGYVSMTVRCVECHSYMRKHR